MEKVTEPEVPKHRKKAPSKKPFAIEWRIKDFGWDCVSNWSTFRRYNSLEDVEKALEALNINHTAGWEFRINRRKDP